MRGGGHWRLRKNASTLKILSSCNPSVRRGILSDASSDLIKALDDCCKNVLHGNVPLTVYQKGRLRPYKKQLRALDKKKISLKARKKILQKGGFLGAVLKPVLSVLGGILGL